MNLCEQAETLRLLLIMGLVSKAEVIAWADELIATRDDLPGWLLDVSLAANEDEEGIVSKLGDLPCEGDRMMAAYSAIDRFGEALRAGGMGARTAARMLELWASSVKVYHDDWLKAMTPSWIADEVDCGYVSEQYLIRSVEECLVHFAAVRREG
jgi:hypothetical protein